MKKHLCKRLLAYSSAALGFNGNLQTIDAQVVYQNIDPDIYMASESEYDIDFNNDDIFDITFELVQYDWGFWSDFCYLKTYQYLNIKSFDAVLNDVDFTEAYGAANLPQGFEINADANWNTTPTIHLNFTKRDGEGYTCFFEHISSAYDNWLGDDQFLGVRFIIDGAYHYGAVRLSINDRSENHFALPVLVLHDFIYNATPDEPLPINPTAAALAQQVVLTDIAETATAADIQINFSPAKVEAGIQEYRVILIKEGTALPALSVLENLTSDLYLSVTPDGTPKTIVFPADFHDIDNNLITENSYYAVILSIADGMIATINNTSVASNVVDCELQTAQDPWNAEIIKIQNNFSITDFSVQFGNAGTENCVKEYRSFIKNCSYSIDANSLLQLPEINYVVTLPTNAGDYTVTIPEELQIINEPTPSIFQDYESVVVTVPDSITCTYPGIDNSFYIDDDGFSAGYSSLYTEVYPDIPIVTILDKQLNSHSVQVAFNAPPLNNALKSHKIILVPVADSSLIDKNFVRNLGNNTYTICYETGNSVKRLKENQLDAFGNLINPEFDYIVYIIYEENDDDNRISITLPSLPFNLMQNFYSDAPEFEMVFAAQTLTITNLSRHGDVQICNLAGQVILNTDINDIVTNINLSNLPNGIYLVAVLINENKHYLKIVV